MQAAQPSSDLTLPASNGPLTVAVAADGASSPPRGAARETSYYALHGEHVPDSENMLPHSVYIVQCSMGLRLGATVVDAVGSGKLRWSRRWSAQSSRISFLPFAGLCTADTQSGIERTPKDSMERVKNLPDQSVDSSILFKRGLSALAAIEKSLPIRSAILT